MNEIADVADRLHFGAVLNDVLVGRDGQLFLASGGHRILEVASGALAIPDEMVATFRRNIVARRDWSSGRARYLHVIFPDKQSVLCEQYVVPDPVRLGQRYVGACPALADVLLYPLDLLHALGDGAFMRTDTHLTDRASILIACEIAARLTGETQDAARDMLLGRLTAARTHVGDLGAKLSPRESAEEVFADLAWRELWLHNDMTGGNNGMVDIYVTTQARTAGRLLMFGDSFGREACKFLSALFREVVFLRTPFFHPDIAEAICPDVIVTQNVERYLDSVRADDERPSFFMYPHLAGEPYCPSAAFAAAFSAMLSYGRPPYHRLADPA